MKIQLSHELGSERVSAAEHARERASEWAMQVDEWGVQVDEWANERLAQY